MLSNVSETDSHSAHAPFTVMVINGPTEFCRFHLTATLLFKELHVCALL